MKYALLLLLLTGCAAQDQYIDADMDWTAFDKSTAAIQGDVGKYYANKMCDYDQPPINPGEHGVVYRTIGGKCVGELK